MSSPVFAFQKQQRGCSCGVVEGETLGVAVRLAVPDGVLVGVRDGVLVVEDVGVPVRVAERELVGVLAGVCEALEDAVGDGVGARKNP